LTKHFDRTVYRLPQAIGQSSSITYEKSSIAYDKPSFGYATPSFGYRKAVYRLSTIVANCMM
jgi:hypothetical protein